MTMIASRAVGRPATKQQAILDYLYDEILHGDLTPGSRLLTRHELGEKFAASGMTVQQALNRLLADGFVVTRGKEGTFVSECPPHLFRYALVFPDCPDGTNWSRLYGALGAEAVRIQRSQPRTIELFYGLDGHTDGEDYHKLLGEMRGRRLAGIIFAAEPSKLLGTPLLDEPGTPRVAIMSQNIAKLMPKVIPITLDVDSFIDKAMDYFLARGRQRIAAILLSQGEAGGLEAKIVAAAAQRGLTTPAYWRQSVDREHNRWARNCAHMLLRGPAQDRPDALLIADDNLVEHAMTGIVDAGVKVPDELDVVAHCNLPWATPSVVPARRLGFDAREVMRECIAQIDIQRRGEPSSPGSRLAAVFEDELSVSK